MKRSWRGSGVGKETQLQESTSHNNMTNSPNGNGDRSREGNGDGRKNPRSLSFGASSINSSGGVASFTESAHSGLMDNAPSSSSRPRPVSRSLSGPQSPPHNPPRPSHYTMTLDQQKLAAIQEALPAVTRKVTACAACRKQKIKCIMDNDEPPCQRCVQRGLSCVLNRSLQSLMNDTRRIHALQGDLHQMHTVLTNVCQAINLKLPPPLTVPYTSDLPSAQQEKVEAVQESADEDKEMADASPPMSPSDMKGPIDTFLEPAKSVAESPASAAVASPHASINSQRRSIVAAPDIISKGIVSLSMAETLVGRYTQRLDHYLYGIGSMFSDLKSLRKLSPVLLAAVCAVSALHEQSGSRVFEACNTEFLKLVSQSMFEKRGVEFLRALCIGSYWLSDASRILSSDALRRSSDVRLQKYFYQVTVPDSITTGLGLPPAEMVDRVRLWYLFYISDQHLSILYNRDPIVNADQDIILGWEAFLESEYTDESDVRIASQVVLLQMMSHIRSSFGPESTEPLSKGLATSVKNFNGQIDTWFARFSSNFSAIHNKIGDFPHKGLTLHYHFAKLYLGHHVFRGLKSDPIPVYFLPAALMAHGAATFIFELILSDSGLTDSLLGIPFYFHVMISFAGHFLLSCSQYWEQLSIDVGENLQLMGKAIEFFKSFSCVEQHPLHKMTVALENKYHECRAIVDRANNTETTNNNFQFNGALPPTGLPANFAPPQQWGGTGQGGNGLTGMNNNTNMNGLSNQGAGNLPPTYAMVAPHGDTGFDINFQDLDGFNFPDLDFTH